MPALADLAGSALALWEVPEGARLQLINLSENATYLVEAAGGYRSVLRLHREGYHSRRAIECELAIAGHDGKLIQSQGTSALVPRHLVMFEWLDGVEPDPDDDLVEPFRQLGGIAARAHLHVTGWQLPDGFERLVWDDESVFGPSPNWGDWRDGPGVDARVREVLEAAETLVRDRLTAYGRGAARYGLIHADMRLANLLIDGGDTRLIDFDDCGFGWFMYDFAAGISFMEEHPQVPALREAWLDGYRAVRPLDGEDEVEIDSFIMLRRMALLAWTGSHAGTDLARSQAPHFAAGTARLAEAYLARFA